MAIEIGKIFRSFIEKNLDSTVPTQLFQAELAEEGDSQTIEELHIPGFQYRPAPSSRTFVARVTGVWKICLGIDDFVPKETLLEGERLIYSDAAGIIKTKIHLKVDGSIDIITTSAVNVTGDVIADGISLKTHTHSQANDSGGNTESNTSAPL